MLQNETHVLAPIISPEDATVKEVQWSSSNKDVVRVTEDGVLIGLQQGRAIVTALIRDDYGTHTAICEVTVTDGTGEDLTVDTGYGLNDEDKTMENVSSGETVEDVKENIETNGTVTIVNKDGETLKDEDKIGTGSKVTITKDDEKVEYVVIIEGDINGDGEVTTTDLQQVIDSIIGK